MNRLFKESVRSEDLMTELRPLLTRYATERHPGERFGDWCHRTILAAANPVAAPPPPKPS